ncbi:MAG: hypothetical protein PHV62_08990 [Sulfuricurvum sp.]|nr:hypothetical protein [Sulfuricurvum sp.]
MNKFSTCAIGINQVMHLIAKLITAIALCVLVVIITISNSAFASTDAVNSKSVITLWYEVVISCIVALIAALIFSGVGYYKLTRLSKESRTWSGFFDYIIAEKLVTIFSFLIVGYLHCRLGGLIGHNIERSIVIVTFISLGEHLTHRLLEVPNSVIANVQSIRKAVSDAVPKALNAKQIFVTGALNSKTIQEMVAIIDSHKDLVESHCGISIFKFNSSPGLYSDICRHFLSGAKIIESMSDMDLDIALPLFRDNKGHVMTWVDDVNKKKQAEPETIVHRIQVLTEERRTFLHALETLTALPTNVTARQVVLKYSRLPMNAGNKEDFDSAINYFIDCAKSGLANFKHNYCNFTDIKFSILPKDSDEIGGGYKYSKNIKTNLEQLPRGELIIFDRKYLVRYNSDAKLLEVHIGDIVNSFVEVFNSSELLSLPIGNNFGDIRLPLEVWYMGRIAK